MLQVCITLQDWETFPETFKNSRNTDEKDLYHTLTEEVTPQVIADLKSKERKKKKIVELASLVPKRSSRLQEKSRLQKIEEEKQEKQRLLEELKQRSHSKDSRVVPINFLFLIFRTTNLLFTLESSGPRGVILKCRATLKSSMNLKRISL